MPKEFFAHSETRPLFDTVEDIARRSKVSRAQAFEDVIRASVAALAAETMESEYFDAINSHLKGEKGKRGVDLFPVFLGQAVDAMSRTDNDVLGDLFQGGISYGEHGLYLTPHPIAELMARMTIDDKTDSDTEPLTICDPCCGTGIMLMEAGKINPRAELIGQDIDARCAHLAAIRRCGGSKINCVTLWIALLGLKQHRSAIRADHKLNFPITSGPQHGVAHHPLPSSSSRESKDKC